MSNEPSYDSWPLLPQKARVDLEWDRLLEALATRCETPAGREIVLQMSEPSKTAALELIRDVSEASLSLSDGEPLPQPALLDIREAVSRASHAGVLSGPELRALALMLGAARSLRKFLFSRREKLVALYENYSTDPTLDKLEDEINRCFEPDGTLSDAASPRLRSLRQERATCRGRMISRIEEIQRRYAAILQDGFWTEREGRYVLPVRSDAHERFPGIVHASSASGSTLFVEPRALIPLGNRLKMLEGEIRREEELVYAHLTQRVVEHLSSVIGAMENLGAIDVRGAIARFAQELNLRYPEISHHETGKFEADLKALKHPLLVLEAIAQRKTSTVIPSDIAIQNGAAIIVSGPNAGGKTVALKALGLAALMFRAGLPIAVQEGSRMSFVQNLLTDVGDDQSLQKSLSTFSAHITNLVTILEAAQPGSLVLLDELAGGTDPREGEALAAAVLDGLCRRGAAVMTTTHYEGLKALALADQRFTNASVGFDEQSLLPTFRLHLGTPGASSALQVAKRFGMPSLILERATQFLSGEDRSFEQTIRALHDERRALELARAAAESERDTARMLREEIAHELELLRARDRRVIAQEAQGLYESVRRARDELRVLQARLRVKKPEMQTVLQAEKGIDNIAGRFAVGGDLEPLVNERAAVMASATVAPDPSMLFRKGMRVFVPQLRAEAEIVDVLGDQLRVAAGSLKLTVDRQLVRIVAESHSGHEFPRNGQKSPMLRSSHARKGTSSVRSPAPSQESSTDSSFLQTTDNTCDIRGVRAADAWPMVEAFLDRCLNSGEPAAIVVHGHGTGALRSLIREELKLSRYASHFRSGRNDEGGEGVTVVWLQA